MIQQILSFLAFKLIIFIKLAKKVYDKVFKNPLKAIQRSIQRSMRSSPNGFSLEKFTRVPKHLAISIKFENPYNANSKSLQNILSLIRLLSSTGISEVTLFETQNVIKTELETILSQRCVHLKEDLFWYVKEGKGNIKIRLMTKSESEKALEIALKKICSNKAKVPKVYDSLKHKDFLRRTIIECSYRGMAEVDVLINVNSDRTLNEFPPWLLTNCQISWVESVEDIDEFYMETLIKKFDAMKTNFGK